MLFRSRYLDRQIATQSYERLLSGVNPDRRRKGKELPLTSLPDKPKSLVPEETLRREIEAQKELYRLQVQDSAEIETLMSPVQPKRKLSSANKNGKTKPCLNDV